MKPLITLIAVLLVTACDQSESKQRIDDRSEVLDSVRPSYSIKEICESLQRQYPEATIQNPANVDGRWAYDLGSVLGPGQIFSREQGNLKWEEISVPHGSKDAVVPVLLSRKTGEAAYLLARSAH